MSLSDVRRSNIRALVEERGGLTKLSKLLGYKNPSFLSQMTSQEYTREVTERTARSIEQALGLPDGHLDRPMPLFESPAVPAAQAEAARTAALEAPAARRPTAAEETVRIVTDTIMLLGKQCEADHVAPGPEKFAAMVAMVYMDGLSHGRPRPEHVKQLVGLLK